MCGIVGYVGKNNIAKSRVIQGLRSLEYRGYDSSGIALLRNGAASYFRQVGRVEALEAKLLDQAEATNSTIGIGHTRWATHGKPIEKNAHPHCNSNESIFVVHNGIIENYQELKAMLVSEGYVFNSQTDTEVIPHLIDHYQKTHASFRGAFEAAVKDLVGAYAIAAVNTPDPETIFLAKLSSPLVVGVGDNEHFVASDASAIMEHTKKVLYLEDYEVVSVTKSKVTIHNIKHAVEVQRAHELLDYDNEKSILGDYPHFMIKEINEAPQTIQTATLGRISDSPHSVKLGGLEQVREQLRFIDRIVIVACGTSYYAGLVGEYLIEDIAGIPVEVQLASEFKYRNEPFSRSTALLAISQSGETADTIAALKKVEGYGVLRLGVVNVVGSTIARMTDAGVYCHAGTEQSVASTKAFIAQVTVLAEIALFLSNGNSKLYKPLIDELLLLPSKAKQVLSTSSEIATMAKKYAGFRDFMFIGRNYGYPCALEGALKLKEVSYIHAEGYAGGELKHGPLALIDKDFPTFALATNGPLLSKTLSNIEEIKARKGPILAVATKGSVSIGKLTKDVMYVPETIEQLQPLLSAIVMQLFAYHVSVHKGIDVDRPRNLAKSVTVE